MFYDVIIIKYYTTVINVMIIVLYDTENERVRYSKDIIKYLNVIKKKYIYV